MWCLEEVRMPWTSPPLAPRLANLRLDSFTLSLKRNLAELKVILVPSTLFNFTPTDEVTLVVERMVMCVFTSLMKLTLILNLISKLPHQYPNYSCLRNNCDSSHYPSFYVNMIQSQTVSRKCHR